MRSGWVSPAKGQIRDVARLYQTRPVNVPEVVGVSSQRFQERRQDGFHVAAASAEEPP